MDGPGTILDDLQELNLDRPTKPLKSSEELESLTVDEQLTDIERAVYLLSSGQEVQRISVITALPALLKDCNEECMKRVVPKVREVLHVAQQDMQLAASIAFLKILQNKLVTLDVYTNTFLKTIVTCVDNKDQEAAAAWLSTLLDVIDLLPTDVIKSDLLGIAISKGQLQQPVPVRLSCCKILGKIATKFEPLLIKKDILPVVQQLCQDVEHEVRACMCYQLDSVARGLGLENTKDIILPEVMELINDEESHVRITALDTVVNILSMLDDEVKVSTVIPFVCKMCQKAMQAEDRTLPAVAKHLGKLCHGLQSNLTDEQKQWLLDFYKKLCKVGLSEKQKGADKSVPLHIDTVYDDDDWHVETRRSAAYNLPAMAIFVGMKNFKTELLATLSSLCKDPHQLVRKTAASGFHEISKILGQQVMILFPDLITLLKDDSIEVLQGVVSTIPVSLEVVSKSGAVISDAKMASIQEVVNTFMLAEAVVFASNNWRLQEDMMRNMSCLAKICSQDMLNNRVIPILMTKMKQGRALPVRHAAARSLLILMRRLHKQDQRDQITHTLIQEFCHGRSCHSRALFIVICKYFIELYSKAFFKDHLFEYILPLTMDPVPNIRMQACGLLPSLKGLIKLPYDNALKGSLEQYVRKMLINDERDKDVAVARNKAVNEMDRIPVQMESMVSRRKNFEDDEDDQVKEEEEKALLVIEEKERKEEEQRAAKGDKKSVHLKKDGTKLSGPKKSFAASKGATSGSPKPCAPLARKDSKGAAQSPSSSQLGSPSRVKTTPRGATSSNPKPGGSLFRKDSKGISFSPSSPHFASPSRSIAASRGAIGSSPRSGGPLARRESKGTAYSPSSSQLAASKGAIGRSPKLGSPLTRRESKGAVQSPSSSQLAASKRAIGRSPKWGVPLTCREPEGAAYSPSSSQLAASRGATGSSPRSGGLLARRESEGTAQTPSSPKLVTSVAAGSSLNKMKASPTSQRLGNTPNPTPIGATQRKGSAGNMPSFTSARRGSLGSAGSTNSGTEPTSTRGMKPKASGASTSQYVQSSSMKTRKTSKP